MQAPTTKAGVVYILYNNQRKKIYIGSTTDLETRLLRHNGILPSKKTSYTYKNDGTWIIAYKEEYVSIKEAQIREKWFKSGIGRKFISENLNSWLNIAQLADPPKANF